jgi:hypothetical protein
MAPNANAFAERFVRSIKSECLDRMIFFGVESLHRVIAQYVEHYHAERNHQGLENAILEPGSEVGATEGRILRRQRLGGMLNYYYRRCLTEVRTHSSRGRRRRFHVLSCHGPTVVTLLHSNSCE